MEVIPLPENRPCPNCKGAMKLMNPSFVLLEGEFSEELQLPVPITHRPSQTGLFRLYVCALCGVSLLFLPQVRGQQPHETKTN